LKLQLLVFVQWLHYYEHMPTVCKLPNKTIRVNTPDHLPPHVHVVMADRRDAVVDLDTLAVTSRTLRASDIADALVWIEANRAHCIKFFKECNP
jgi:hypothetical protein